jgi:hypothetical protein
MVILSEGADEGANRSGELAVLRVVDRARHDRRHRLPERVAEDRAEVGRTGRAEKAVVNGSVSPSTGRMPTAANPERHTETSTALSFSVARNDCIPRSSWWF